MSIRLSFPEATGTDSILGTRPQSDSLTAQKAMSEKIPARKIMNQPLSLSSNPDSTQKGKQCNVSSQATKKFLDSTTTEFNEVATQTATLDSPRQTQHRTQSKTQSQCTQTDPPPQC